jgi:hypothetical protein
MPLHAMSKTELLALSTSLNLKLPDSILNDRDRKPIIDAISEHLKSLPPAGKGGKKRTIKKKQTRK